jgi:uncharacterized membrane protein YfcA
MFGLDDKIAGLSGGGSVLVVILVAALLGLRHATDPDHLAAVTTLASSGRSRAATRLGAFWGLGHALTLVAFGVPIVLFEAYLPDVAQRGAETTVGALIIFLALRLLVRHRHRPHDGRHEARGPLAAFGIGLVHGIGGSAGVAVLLLAAMPSKGLALVSLVVLAAFTAVSMTLVTWTLGATLLRRSAAIAPVVGVASLAFGVWYSASAWALAPSPF